MKKTKKQSRVELVDVYSFPPGHSPRVEVVTSRERVVDVEYRDVNADIERRNREIATLRSMSLPAIYTKAKENSRAKKVRGGVLLGGTSVEEIAVTLLAAAVWLAVIGLITYVMYFKKG